MLFYLKSYFYINVNRNGILYNHFYRFSVIN